MPQKKILIVEDNLITAFHLEKLLANYGFEIVDKLGYAENVLDIVKEKGPQLILMDVMLLGDMSGIEAVQLLRQQYAIPVIFVTALSDAETGKKIQQIENTDTVQKPFDEKELIDKIKAMIVE